MPSQLPAASGQFRNIEIFYELALRNEHQASLLVIIANSIACRQSHCMNRFWEGVVLLVAKGRNSLDKDFNIFILTVMKLAINNVYGIGQATTTYGKTSISERPIKRDIKRSQTITNKQLKKT